jgi:hypothetical protein
MDNFRTENASDFALDYDEQRLPDGVRIAMPRRVLGQLRWLGLAAVLVGSFGLVFMAVWLSLWMSAGWQIVQQGQWFGWLLCAVGLAVLAVLRKCWQLLALGVATAANRTSSEIEIRDETVYLHERFGAVRWTRKIQIPVSDIRTLWVGIARHQRSQADAVAMQSWLGSYHSAIYAELDEDRAPVLMAPCYPPALLAKLAARLAVLLPNAAVVKREPAVKALRTNSSDEAPPVAKIVKQPVASDIQVERRAGGTTYRVPPAGLLKGSKGLFLFAVIWNVAIGVFVAICVASTIKEPITPHLAAVLFMIPFIAIGVITMLAAINMGRRKTVIVTAGDELLVISEGIFGKKTRRWHASELSHVHVGPSGISVNDVPVMELQFRSGKVKFGVLSERSYDELEWLAVQVSLELGLLNVEFAAATVDQAETTP